MQNTLYLLGVLLIYLCSSSCNEKTAKLQIDLIDHSSVTSTFGQEVAFLKKFTDMDILQESSGKGIIAVSKALQARVMTSSSNGQKGRSYGWINRDLFESGDTLAHINPFGGEERFWLGPEGGQYSIFFKKGAPFDLDNWQTPALIDLEAFELKNKSAAKAVYAKDGTIINYSGFSFDLHIERSIEVLSPSEIFSTLKLTTNDAIKVVGYQTTNTLTNTGKVDWKKETGLLSIWLLGMYNPSDATTIVIPFKEGEANILGPVVNDNYFGKVPAERLKVGEGVLFFSGDGLYRSKIGLRADRAQGIAASYDAYSQTLTIVKYHQPEGNTDYVNSLWEIQKEPYRGDAINSYNDGPPEPDKKPLGPFYELETSSPALALKVGESGTHTQQTFHFEGGEKHLDEIARKLLGVSIADIKNALY
jgi:hypothetical protein